LAGRIHEQLYYFQKKMPIENAAKNNERTKAKTIDSEYMNEMSA